MTIPVLGEPLILLHLAGSTNDVAFLLHERGFPPGTTVVARRQSVGRGRSGHRWESPEGGLYMSALLRPDLPPDDLLLLPAAAGLAVRAAVSRFVPGALVKWPNDILAGGRKLSGVLVETRGGAVVAGIGVNVDPDPARLPDHATSLAILGAQGATPSSVRGPVLEELALRLDRLHCGLAAELEAEFAAVSWLTGRCIEASTAGETVTGTVERISLREGLHLRTPGGVRVLRAAHTHIVAVR